MIDSFRRAATITAVLAVVFVASALDLGGLHPTDLARDVVLLGLNTVPLLFVHRQPLLVVLVFCVAYPLWLDTGHEGHLFQSLPTLVALYALGAWARPLWLRAIGLVAPAWMTAAVLTGLWPGAGLSEVGYVAVMFALVWALGVVVAARRSTIRQLEEKTAALQHARRELADRAVADERARIARELHDVVAHAMSVITVRAGVGAHLAGADPAHAREALDVIERTGREALSEMRRMLAVLRDPDPQAPQGEPQPGLGDLSRLATAVRDAGVTVTVITSGEVATLPAGLELAAYRVVQEALTNVVKHAPGARATVRLSYLPGALEVDVHNPARVGQSFIPGQGIRGMAERVALYDGRFTAHPSADGFRVTARFPLETAPSGGDRPRSASDRPRSASDRPRSAGDRPRSAGDTVPAPATSETTG